jgi:hypothetical protein
MKGTLRVHKLILEHGCPEIIEVINTFIDQASTVTCWMFEPGTAMKNMDHPDFDVEDARYVLVIKDFRDPDAFFNRTFRLDKLLRVDEAGKHITVKEYTNGRLDT